MIMKTPGTSSRRLAKRINEAKGIKNSKDVKGHSGNAYFLKLSLMLWNNFLTSNKIPFSSKLLGNALIGYNPGCKDNFIIWNSGIVNILLVFLGKSMEYHNEIWLSQVERWPRLSLLESPFGECFGYRSQVVPKLESSTGKIADNR